MAAAPTDPILRTPAEERERDREVALEAAEIAYDALVVDGDDDYLSLRVRLMERFRLDDKSTQPTGEDHD